MKIPLLIFFYAVTVFAGDSAGNSGDMVICDTETQPSYSLLDYFEGKQSHPPFQFDLGGSGQDYLAKAKYAVGRIQELDPERAKRYKQEIELFPSRIDWIESGPPLEDLQDSGTLALPSNCKAHQLAIRRKVFHPSIKPYLIDKRLWALLNADHQAGLVLHEIIYAEMINLGHDTSVEARKYNYLLSSRLFETVSKDEYKTVTEPLFQMIYKAEFRSQEFDVNALKDMDFSLSLRSLLLHPVNKNLKWGIVEALPAWLTLNKNKETLEGIPPEKTGEPLTFTLTVHDGKQGALCLLHLSVH